jgi:hypothetical protein
MHDRSLFYIREHDPTPTSKIDVSKGPDKADLLRAVTSPAEHFHVTFSTALGVIEAHLDKIEELADGVTFGIRGHVVSGRYDHSTIAGTYDTSSHTGHLIVKEPQRCERTPFAELRFP